MGVVVGRVDTPLVPGAGMGGILDPVGHRVQFTVFNGQLHAEGDLEKGRGETRLVGYFHRYIILFV